MTDAWIGLPLTRITALHPDGRVDIDKDLIPPVANYQASALICTWLSWINDLIKMRANSLAERLTGATNTVMKRRKCLITCFCKFLIVSAPY